MNYAELKLHASWLGLALLCRGSPRLRTAGAHRAVRAALAWMRRGDRDVWPTVDSLRLAVTLKPPGAFAGEARMELSGLRGHVFGLLLNRDLDVQEAHDDEGRRLLVLHGFRLPGRRHPEARMILFCLPEPPPSGRTALHLRYAGRCASGRRGPDWRGILMVGESEARMTEQSAFYPSVPTSWQGPGLLRSEVRLEVEVPSGFEVVAPGRRTETPGGWIFQPECPALLCLVAGRLVRHVATGPVPELVVLLRSEHADLAARIAAEAQAALVFYRGWLGEIRSLSDPVTIAEIQCRPGTSYNWAAEGIVAIDRKALRDGIPLGPLAHELAHLWWGIGVRPDGVGERFLTESTAEYASWRFLEQRCGAQALARAEERAHARVGSLRPQQREIPLREVTARTRGYGELVYAKGPLALRQLERSMGRPRFDTVLRSFIQGHRGGSPTLDEFRRALVAAGEDDRGIPGMDR